MPYSLPPLDSLALPAWWTPARADDVDQVCEMLQTGAGRVSVVQRQHGAVGYEQRTLTGAAVRLRISRSCQRLIVRGHVTAPTLHLVMPLGCTYRAGRRDLTLADAGAAIFVPPDLDFTRHGLPGDIAGLQFDPGRLRAELEARAPGNGAPWSLRLSMLTLSAAERAGWLAAVGELLLAAAPGSDPRCAPRAEGRLTALLADSLLRGAVASRVSALAASRAAALEDWIDAHLGEPLTLGRLCDEAGVGARCLQATFSSRRGMSPMRFVTERRLSAARERLLQASPHESVTSIALECGFDHMSRFAQAYKHAYGESPSRTLAGR